MRGASGGKQAEAFMNEGKFLSSDVKQKKKQFVRTMQAIRYEMRYGRNSQKSKSPNAKSGVNGFLSDKEYDNKEYTHAADRLPLLTYHLEKIAETNRSYEWSAYTNDTNNQWKHMNYKFDVASRTLPNQYHRIGHYILKIDRVATDAEEIAKSMLDFSKRCTDSGLTDLGKFFADDAQKLSDEIDKQKKKSSACIGRVIKKYINKDTKGKGHPRAKDFCLSLIDKKVNAKKKRKIIDWVENTKRVVKAIRKSQKDFIHVHRKLMIKYLSTNKYGVQYDSLNILKRMMVAYENMGEDQEEEVEKLKNSMWLFERVYSQY